MKKTQFKRRAVFFLVCVTATAALIWLFSALNSTDQHIQIVALKLLSLCGFGALMVMAIASLSRIPDPGKGRRV